MKYYKFWSNIYKFLPLPWPKYDSQHFTPYHKLNYILLGFFISSFLLSIKKNVTSHGKGWWSMLRIIWMAPNWLVWCFCNIFDYQWRNSAKRYLIQFTCNSVQDTYKIRNHVQAALLLQNIIKIYTSVTLGCDQKAAMTYWGRNNIRGSYFLISYQSHHRWLVRSCNLIHRRLRMPF